MDKTLFSTYLLFSFCLSKSQWNKESFFLPWPVPLLLASHSFIGPCGCTAPWRRGVFWLHGNSLPFQSAEKANSYWCTWATGQHQISNPGLTIHFWLLRAALPFSLHRLQVLFPLLCPALVCLPGMPCSLVPLWLPVLRYLGGGRYIFLFSRRSMMAFGDFSSPSFSLSFLIRSLSWVCQGLYELADDNVILS